MRTREYDLHSGSFLPTFPLWVSPSNVTKEVSPVIGMDKRCMCIVNIDPIERQKKTKRVLFDKRSDLLWIFDPKFRWRIHGNYFLPNSVLIQCWKISIWIAPASVKVTDFIQLKLRDIRLCLRCREFSDGVEVGEPVTTDIEFRRWGIFGTLRSQDERKASKVPVPAIEHKPVSTRWCQTLGMTGAIQKATINHLSIPAERPTIPVAEDLLGIVLREIPSGSLGN